MAYYYRAPPIPQAFIWRRAHSLTGLWLVLFLIEHLLTNSQAALYIGDDGSGFISAVNFLKGLPYLEVIEITLLGIPLLIHGLWGIKYLFTAKYNSFSSDGTTPSLGQYTRNQAYTWQRITSWVLLFGIIAHVIHMRFLEYPTAAQMGIDHYYMVRLGEDPGLSTLSKRLGFDLVTFAQLPEIKHSILSTPFPEGVTPEQKVNYQHIEEQRQWLQALEKRPINQQQVIAISKEFGVAVLLMVRDTFKSPLMIMLYTGLVLAACFHAFNGLWTFMISWGITLTAASQRFMRILACGLMVLITFLGLAAIWGTYLINLKS